MHRFTVIENFYSEELRSGYMAGMSYQAGDQDEKLLSLIPKWIEEGKVRLGGTVAKVTGGGEVVETKAETKTKTQTRSK